MNIEENTPLTILLEKEKRETIIAYLHSTISTPLKWSDGYSTLLLGVSVKTVAKLRRVGVDRVYANRKSLLYKVASMWHKHGRTDLSKLLVDWGV